MTEAERREFLVLAEKVSNTMKADLTWEERYDLIFNDEVSRRIFQLVHLDYCDPDTSEEEDVRAFARAVAAKAESAARQSKAICSPTPPTFTLDEVMVMFRNLGIDTECGACMGVAFTGHTFSGHSCGKQE